jgi:hypothetical protein
MPSSIKVVHSVGVPSSSTLSEPRRPARVPSSVVHHGDARRRHALTDATGERGAALAIEITFQAMANGLVQQHARPTRPQHHRHAAGRRFDRLQVHQCLAHRLIGESHGSAVVDQFAIAITATATGAALLTPIALLGDDLHVKADQRTHVRRQRAIGGGH